MSEFIDSCFRRFPRYPIANHADLTVMIDPDGGFPLNVMLVDISCGGAKFAAISPIKKKQPIAIYIGLPNSQRKLEVNGQVLWAQRVRPSVWHMGCAFTQQLSEEVLTSLAEEGVIERRRHQRYPTSLTASAKWELEADKQTVSVVDYSSEGGVRLFSPTAGNGKSGKGVELQFDAEGSEVLVRAKSQWEGTTDDGHHVGCEFLTGQDAGRFCAVENTRTRRANPCRRWYEAVRRSRAIMLLGFLGRRRRFRRVVSYSAIACFAVMLGAVLSPVIPEQTWDQLNRHAHSQFATITDHWRHSPAPRPLTVENADRTDEETVGQEQTVAKPLAPADIRPFEESDTHFVSTSALTDEPTVDEGFPETEGTHFTEESPEDTGPGLPRAPTRQVASPEFPPLAVTDVEVIPTPDIPAAGPDDALSRQAAPDHQASATSGESSVASEDPSVPAPVVDRQRAQKAYRSAISFIRRGDHREAIAALEAAIEADPIEPLYWYLLALGQWQTGETESAERSITHAAELERTHPITNWGRQMERYQGRARVWLEQARRRGLSVKSN